MTQIILLKQFIMGKFYLSEQEKRKAIRNAMELRNRRLNGNENQSSGTDPQTFIPDELMRKSGRTLSKLFSTESYEVIEYLNNLIESDSKNISRIGLNINLNHVNLNDFYVKSKYERMICQEAMNNYYSIKLIRRAAESDDKRILSSNLKEKIDKLYDRLMNE